MPAKGTGVWSSGRVPPNWKNVRRYVLERDGYVCQVQLPQKCTGAATEAHHTLGADADPTDVRYLVAACKPCNSSVQDPRTKNTDEAELPPYLWKRVHETKEGNP